MKFSCERCGKRYATADTPAPGRIYKIKCKACGHLIVVKAPTGAATSASTAMRPPTSVGIPAVNSTTAAPQLRRPSPPDLELEIGAPERAAPAASSGAAAGAAHQLAPPPGDSGYVDLFAEPQKPEQPRQSDGFGAAGPAADPFASLGQELSSPPADAPAPAAGRPTTPVPVIPKPSPPRSAMPIILVAVGAVVLAGILAFVLLGGRPAATPPPRAQAPASAQQVQPAAPAPLPAPSAAPAEGAPQPAEAPQRTDTSADRAR